MDYGREALRRHKQLRGKLAIQLKDTLSSKAKLSTYYTPGVGAVSSYVAKHPNQAREFTWLNNSVAVISDGSAVLGLGNLGPYGALPVMEGKCMLFKHFAGIDAVPIVLDVHSADEIVEAVCAIAPSFGGINLEDIAAPICFEVEERVKARLRIPVMHDDQHGTAIVVLAGLINAERAGGWSIGESKIVIAGTGAAGIAIANLLWQYGAQHILMVDSKGIVGPKRKDLNSTKKQLLRYNVSSSDGNLVDALQEAHIFIGVSQPSILTADMVRNDMAKHPIIFAMANPVPEILPDIAKKAGAYIVATGRSDFPNQVNNALAFPGVFRGALDHQISSITDKHKINAAEAIASLVSSPSPDKIIPSVLDEKLVPTVAKVII